MSEWQAVCAEQQLAEGEFQVVWEGDTAIAVYRKRGGRLIAARPASVHLFELDARRLDQARGLGEAEDFVIVTLCHGRGPCGSKQQRRVERGEHQYSVAAARRR